MTKILTPREIKKATNRITAIWKEMESIIAGTGVGSLIEELVELELLLDQECNK